MDITRSVSVFNPEVLTNEVHIIGVGATGSFLLQTLVRFGVTNIHIYDNDEYEIHNVNNQAILQKHCDMKKVEAQVAICKEINPEVNIIAHDDLVIAKDIENFSGYVFLLVDSMATRLELFNAMRENKDIIHVWESRLGSDQGRVYSLPMQSESREFDLYTKSHFYSDEQAEVSACGTSITIVSIVHSIVGLMVNQFIQIVNGQVSQDAPIHDYTLFDSMYNTYTEDFLLKDVVLDTEECDL